MSKVEFIFGGSFDPIHNGHINIIESLIAEIPMWPIRILPCAVPALKKATSARFWQRCEMISLATEFMANVEIDTREFARKGKSYTIDTLIDLKKQYPERRFIVVIGSDNLDSIEQWHKSDQLRDFCHLLVVSRPNSTLNSLGNKMKKLEFHQSDELRELEREISGFYFVLSIEEKDISSTNIRAKYEQKVERATNLPLVVQQYIKDNFIYQ